MAKVECCTLFQFLCPCAMMLGKPSSVPCSDTFCWCAGLFIHRCIDLWTWINDCLEWWYGRVFRFYGWYFRSNSLARKREATKYNTAELIQARQIMAVPIHGESTHKNVVNSYARFTQVWYRQFVSTRAHGIVESSWLYHNCVELILLQTHFVLGVPVGSPSRGGDVKVCVLDIN